MRLVVTRRAHTARRAFVDDVNRRAVERRGRRARDDRGRARGATRRTPRTSSSAMRSFLADMKRQALSSTSTNERAPPATTAWVSDFNDDASGAHGGGAFGVSGAARTSTSSTVELHPLAREWGARVSSKTVRRAFERESIDAYTSQHPLKVFCGTWNTNGKAPKEGMDVRLWLKMDDRGGFGADAADVVVVGFQEIIPLTPGNVLAVQDSAQTEMWEAVLDRALNGNAANQESTRRRGVYAKSSYERAAERTTPAPTNASWVNFEDDDAEEDDIFRAMDARNVQQLPPVPTSKGVAMYRPVAQKQLVGVYVTVWVKATLLTHITEVRVSTVSTGINLGLGVLGNKGAAAVWMKLRSTPLVFICSHLSAGSKLGDEVKRNDDYKTIVDQLAFESREGVDMSQEVYKIDDAASAIWIGDLNYRLNLPDDIVRASIAAGNISSLLAADQLNVERAAGRTFVGWHESEVTFAPTYKYRPGTNVYSGAGDADDSDIEGAQKKEEEKKRTPAWCDRILWKGDFDINLIDYGRAELTHSDHKPVYALFSLVVRELQPQKLQDLLFNLRRQLDAEEMKSQPTCEILNPIVDLGRLRYAEESSGRFTMSNTGDVPANFSLVSPVPGGPPHPAWLKVNPTRGALLPGEKCVVNIQAKIEGGRMSGPTALSGSRPTSSNALDTLVDVEPKPTAVDAILVMRLEGGRDFFVSVQGQYTPCAFGQSLETLPTAMFPPNVPQAVGTLVDYLFESTSAAPGLFRVPFDNVTTKGGIAAVSRALSGNALGGSVNLNVPGVNAYDVGQALISFFSALPERLLSNGAILTAADAVNPDSPPSKEFADALVNAHLSIKARATLRHVMTLVHRLTEECVQTGSALDVAAIISTFAKCWFPESPSMPSRSRVALVGILAGCRPSFIRAYVADSAAPTSSAFAPQWASVAAPAPTLTTQSSGNLIDFD